MRIHHRATLSLVGLAAACLSIVVSCALPGFDKVPEVSTSSSTGAGGSCAHALPPLRPSVPDNPAGVLDLVFAIKTVDFGETKALADRPGLDLDRACSCEEASPAVCTLPSWTVMDQRCDSQDGRDNAAADLIGYIKSAIGTGSEQYSAAITTGTWSIILEVSQYDGTPDDSHVTLALYMTPGLGGPPKWDGKDTWPIRPESLMGTDPVIVDNDAYVVNGQLVGVVSGSIVLDGDLTVKIASGIGMASLTQNGAAWELDGGLLAGTWAVDDALAGIGNLIYGGVTVCTNALVYTVAKKQICDRVDIASAPALPCDSLSFGMSFTAGAALKGALVAPETPEAPCPADKCGP